MRARSCARRLEHVVILAVVATLLLIWPGLAPAGAADARLERVLERRRSVQVHLDALVARMDTLQAETAGVENRLAELNRLAARHQREADVATGTLGVRVRESYKRGTGDPTLALFASGSVQQAAQQARLLGLLATRSRDEVEAATSARVRTQVSAGQVNEVRGELRARRVQLDAARDRVVAALAEADREERAVRVTLAAEEAARAQAEARAQVARAQAARARATREQPVTRGRATARRPTPAVASRVATAAAAPVSGGIACPVGQPRSYSDTYGAPRSGGRSHKGTDILAPRGTPIYAYEAGTISRMNSSSVGGISLYLRGASGNLYYYTHLQGYASGLGAGQRVSVGQHIASNGDTGNARGTPHLHFEVMPGGGGNVNPYPYVRRACG